jgi:hypothetical protein
MSPLCCLCSLGAVCWRPRKRENTRKLCMPYGACYNAAAVCERSVGAGWRGVIQMISLWVWCMVCKRQVYKHHQNPITFDLYQLSAAIFTLFSLYLVTERHCCWRINAPRTVTLMCMLTLSLLNYLGFHWQILMVLQRVVGLTAVVFGSTAFRDYIGWSR